MTAPTTDTAQRPRSLPAAPERESLYRHRVSILKGLRDVWRARAIIGALAERQMRTRYKQALLGFLWAIITPFTLMVAFTVVFGRIADVDTGGVPYAVFAFVGIVAWDFTSTSLNQGSLSLVNSLPLLNKINCPREVFPLSFMAVSAVDCMLSLVALGVLFAITTTMPAATSWWVLFVAPVHLLFTAAVVLGSSILVVYVRDLRYALPLLLQLGLLVTPVAYGTDSVPEQWRGLFAALNPLSGIIDGYRRAVLLGSPPGGLFVVSALSTLVLFAAGYWLFRRLEIWITDVA